MKSRRHTRPESIPGIFLKQRAFLSGSILEYCVIGIIFFLLTLAYTDFVLLHASHRLFIEGPGDGTAGFLWILFADKGWGGILAHSNLVNYPVGENLANPTFITYSALLIPLWVMSRLAGPITALNIVTFFGFFACAMAMYWLVKRLIRNKLISFFAGYASAFVPYHIMKSSAHLAYLFSVVFVLIIAGFIGLWRQPKSWKRALIFAAAIALAYYTDGYYLLLASFFVGCNILASFIYLAVSKAPLPRVKAWLIGLIRMGVVLMLLCLPILFTQFSQSKNIQSHLSSARDGIGFDLDFYSSKKIDYLLPSVHHPSLINNETFLQMQQYKNSRSNTSENTLYVGYVVILLCVIGFVLLAGWLVSRKKSTISSLSVAQRRSYIFLGAITFVSVPMMLYASLPPFLYFMGHKIPTLGGFFVLSGITLWRVMSRFFLPMHVLLVLFAAVTLSVLYRTVGALKIDTKRANFLRISVFLLLTLGTAFEYASATSRPAFDFNNLPRAYKWLKTEKGIQVIAETPLLDRPLDVNYLFTTAQIVHGKKLINTHLTNNPVGGRTALGKVDNPDTIDYALARGADAIITHDEKCITQPVWGRLVYQDNNKASVKEAMYYGSPICIYKLNQAAHPDPFYAQLKKGTFSDEILMAQKNDEDYSLIYGDKGVIQVRDQLGRNVSGRARIEAGITSSPKSLVRFQGRWRLFQDGKILSEGNAPGFINSEVDASKDITVEVRDLKGKEPQLYQIALNDIVITKL